MSSSQWYPEGYTHPTSNAYPPGPQHPAYTSKTTAKPGEPVPWYITEPHAHSGVYKPTSRTSASASASSGSASYSLPVRLPRDPDLEKGIDYFKIGETVRVRKYLSTQKTYTDWVYGQVTRPHLRSFPNGTTQRVYFVSYTDPRNGRRKEYDFTPALREIAPLLADERNGPGPIVFALVDVDPSVQVWTAARVMTNSSSENGVIVRLLTGPQANRDIKGIRNLVPYNTSVAASLRKLGMRVEGDGRPL